jgi:type I restriction enzyme M protein
MVDLVDPTIGEKLIDPACGTGGFLIRAYDVVSNKIQASELTSEEKQERLQSLATQCLVGIDWEPRAARTCKMNMIIHGDGHAGVYQANSLRLDVLERKVAQRQSLNPRAPSVEEGTFDIVLTNPPFGARDSDNSILEEFELGRGRSAKREVLMIERCIRLLRPGGRMAVVVPEGILSNKLDKRIRDFIRRECVLKAIIRLPQDAFKMSGGAACTSIIYAVKRDPNVPDLQEQDDVFFARAEYIGTTPSGKPIEQNDLLAIKEQFRRFEEGEWTGIELRSRQGESMDILRSVPTGDSRLWLEPEVNRTSLLYDRLSYVVRDPQIVNRYSYTYFHPRYYEIVNELGAMLTEVADLESLCVAGYPTRGKKPSQESSEGIPILKVRNITGRGIDLDTEYAPNTEKIREDCAEAIVQQNDVLITCTGEGTIGRADVYPYKDIAIADGHVSICRLGPGIDPWYVLEYLRSEHGQIQMLRHISGSTGQTELLRQYVKGLRIPVPELSLQEELVHLMREARDRADHLREKARHLHNESIRVIAEARDQMIRKLQA